MAMTPVVISIYKNIEHPLTIIRFYIEFVWTVISGFSSAFPLIWMR